MCLQCGSAEKMAEKLKMGITCNGEEMFTMTLAELKDKIFHEWIETEKTDFRIFKKGILGIQKDSITWKVSSPINAKKTAMLRIHFI